MKLFESGETDLNIVLKQIVYFVLSGEFAENVDFGTFPHLFIDLLDDYLKSAIVDFIGMLFRLA